MNRQSDQTWRNLHPFDRLYAQHLKEFYREIEEQAPIIWPGMQLCPVCIFRQNGPAFLYKHPDPPTSFLHVGDGLWLGEQSALQLFGATQTAINDVLTAINCYDREGRPLELFYAELFHEMHHVYQRNHMPSLRFDNPALLITYPENVENDALRLLEGRTLLQMVLSRDPEMFADQLNIFFSARERRQQIIGSQYIDMEKRAESMEGPATYCEYGYLQSRRQTAWDRALFTVAQQQEFLSILSQLLVGRQQLRYRLLMTGLAQCLILAKHNVPNWERTYFNSDALLSDFLFAQFPVRRTDIPDIDDLRACASYYLGKEQQDRQRRVAALENQDGVRVDATFRMMPECRAIDPMHAEAIDENTVLHNTMLKLGRGDNFLSFLNGGVIARIADNVWNVLSVTFCLQTKEQMRIEAGTISISLEDRQLRWRGEIVSESEENIALILE